MKKVILSASLLVGITATAQVDYEKRVGVNTDKPRASLEVKAINNGYTQGILFPHIDEDEKARWTKNNEKGLVAGTVIWNTTKLCLDYFDGTNWQCTDGTKTNVHPTKWTPGSGSFTGKAVWGDEAGEVISIAKNNCPTGQTGVLLNYPANTAQQITYTATSNVSQADADQKALALMNSAEKQQERQRLAQEYANANGTCQASSTTYTGRAVWGDEVSEFILARKNNCPTGQTGTEVKYPALATHRFTYTATSTVSQEDANRKAMEILNSQEKQQQRQTFAQAYANETGSCTPAPGTLTCNPSTFQWSGRTVIWTGGTKHSDRQRGISGADSVRSIIGTLPTGTKVIIEHLGNNHGKYAVKPNWTSGPFDTAEECNRELIGHNNYGGLRYCDIIQDFRQSVSCTVN